VQQPSVGIPPGGAVLVARGTSATRLLAEGPPGTTMALRLILSPDWAGIVDAIGGGPEIVRAGVPVFRSGEAFTTLQLQPRAPRTAVGQLADGRILLVAVDGRQPGYSVGLTNFELAQTLVRLGAVTGMALDSGGSTTIAFDGTVLNRPSDGRERSISTALMLVYSGIYALPLATDVVSPNGDGVGETQRLAFKVVRPSTVTVSLVAPDGTVAYSETSSRAPGTYGVAFPPPPPPPPPEGEPPPALPLAEGTWAFTLSAQDDQAAASSDARSFSVNTTLGFLRVTPARLTVSSRGGALTIAWTQARDARTTVTIETLQGVVLRTVLQRALPAGEQSALWNGRMRGGALAAAGRYRARVTARNDAGVVSLARAFTVRRV
jgi:Phosphodiester glycosidase/FlgD Ig-like domain